MTAMSDLGPAIGEGNLSNGYNYEVASVPPDVKS